MNAFEMQSLLNAAGNRKKYIASVHFMPLEKNDLRHIKKGPYRLDSPRAKGEVEVLEVTDALQQIAKWDNHEEPGVQEPAFVPVEGIVMDLIRSWAGERTGLMKGVRPGVMEIKSPIPTEEEKKKLFKMEFDFCVACVQEADIFHAQPVLGNAIRRIQPRHRMAHEWLAQYDGNFKRRVWATAQTMELTKRGAASGKSIPLHAEFDDGIDLVKFYQERNYNPLDYGDTYLAAKMETAKAPAKATR